MILDGAEPQRDEADPQVDDEDLEEQADNDQAKVIGDLVASVQQLQGELVAQKALVAKQVADSSKLHVSSGVQANTWEELYCVKTDKCGRNKTKKCQTGCPTCRVKVQRFKHSTKGGFGDLQISDLL